MPRITDAAKIGATAAQTGAGGGFFKEANAFINNLKDGIKMFRELQGLDQAAPQAPPESPPGGRALGVRKKAPAPEPPAAPPEPSKSPATQAPASGGFNINKALAVAVALGYGDKTLKDVVGDIGSLTVNQFAELVKDVGPGK